MMEYPMVVTQIADGGYIAAGDWVRDLSGRSPGLISIAASIASISPDGKYLFYTYKNDLYWVSAEVIANLKK